MTNSNDTKEKDLFAARSKMALDRARQQISRSVQSCKTIDCKYNYEHPGTDVCRTPDPRCSDFDEEIENHDHFHPLWNLYCLRFVRMCYGGPDEYRGAINMYQALLASGSMHQEPDIPAGALVFWVWPVYGHVGIYSGDKKVIHVGLGADIRKKVIREDFFEEITKQADKRNHKEKDGESFLGWAYPPKNWL